VHDTHFRPLDFYCAPPTIVAMESDGRTALTEMDKMVTVPDSPLDLTRRGQQRRLSHEGIPDVASRDRRGRASRHRPWSD
jgi:hypothetical protein